MGRGRVVTRVPRNWLEGLGSVLKQAIRNPGFDPRGQPDFGPDHHALWSRVGRQTSVLDLITASALPADRAIAALRDLDRWNAVILVDQPEAAEQEEESAVPTTVQDRLTEPNDDEARLLAEPVELDEQHKRRVLALARMLREGRHHEMLGVAPGSTVRELKRAYFALSKEVHPDRFYGRQLGSFAPLLTTIFEAACQAVKTLSDSRTVAGAKPVIARRRVSARYPFSASVKLRCQSWPEVRRLITQDISTGGMFVPCDAEARAGERVEVELILPSKGLPIVFNRFYNSQDPLDGPLGYGWTHNYNTTLTPKSRDRN